MFKLAKLKTAFSSLGLRIFVGFWLITIISIVSTRWISAQLAQDIMVLAVDDKELANLTHVTERINRYINRAQPKSIRQLFHLKKSLPPHQQLWLKFENNEVYGPMSSESQSIKSFLSTNHFEEPQSIHHHKYQLIGPSTFEFNQQTVQFFLGNIGPNKNSANVISLLPTWARIALPLLISLLLCSLLAWSITRPIKALIATTKKLGSGDLSARTSSIKIGNDEVSLLVKSVDQMAEALQQSLAAQQRLLADVSHELRSPLTRLQLSLALLQNDEPTTENLTKHISKIEREISRIDKLIGEVLQLSRLENALQPLHFEQFNISQLVQQILDDSQVYATANSILLKQTIEDNLILNGDAQLLHSAIENIINNAIKYSPTDNTVDVHVKKQHDLIIVTVQDHGQGVPETELTKIFEPFYRVDNARARKTGGTGLGLAIAQRGIMAHQGQITAKNTDIGLQVTIELPTNLAN